MDDLWIMVLIVAAMLACLVGGTTLYERSVCLAKTEGMGFDVQWSLFGGCKIEVKEGQWIPLDSYYFKEE